MTHAWATGGLATAPISGEAVEVTLEAMRREERLADDAIYDLAGETVVDRHFAAGAQNALLWLRGADEHPPIALTTFALLLGSHR